MVVIFQTVLMRLALCGLAASLVIIALRSRMVRDVFARMLSVWRSLTALGRVAVCAFLLVGVIYGGGKTNSVNNLPPQMMPVPQLGSGLLLTGLPMNGILTNVMNLVQAQATCAERKSTNWNVRGAWKDSFWLPFEDGWVFPWGTNHLSGVEVVSYGQIWPTPFDTNAVVSAGLPFEIVRGLTTFGYEFTSSNSYRFVWTDAAINRDTNNLVSVALELFRNGDVSVSTNGVAALLPRELPFQHDGFGQDAEWVTANFTNATEILAVGYPQWVDAQVGEGLTNGLYKLSITVADDPPETTLLTVGNLSVAVTNAGEYVFLLGKCIDYPLAVFPETATNFTYAAVDDIPSVRSLPMRGMRGGLNDGRWTRDEGRLVLVIPVYPLVPFSESAHIVWTPALSVSPGNWQPSELNDSETFTAVLSDVPWLVSSAFSWSTSDPSIVSISAPSARSTQMTAHYPAAGAQQVSLSLEADVGDCTLHSYYVNDTESQGVGLGVSLAISLPEVVFVNDDDDNDDGTPDCVATFPDDDDIVSGSIIFSSPVPTNGTIVVEGIYGYDGGFAELPLVYANANCTDAITSGRTFAVSGVSSLSRPIYLNPATVSTSVPGVQVKVRWHPESGPDLTASAFLTIVSPVAEPVCNAVTNVVENGVAHSYVVNPCGVAVGREGYFRVDVAPDSFPDSEIVWEKTPGLDFVGPCTGRCVTVRGASTGYETLSVSIGGRTDNAPEFQVHVVETAMVNLRAWIIEDKNLETAFSADQVRQMVKDANDIYAQVGVTLNLIEPIVVTNIPNAYDALYEAPTNAAATWSFDQIVDIDSDTGGLECYFINRFLDSGDTKAAHDCDGIVLTTLSTQYTLAHEIGHAFGLCDIYKSSENGSAGDDPLVALYNSESASFSHLYDDWNGGCDGKGASGARYYKIGTTMANIVDRMLMLGVVPESDSRRDITNGGIYGVHYHYDYQGNKVWEKGLAPLAFPWTQRNPVHN